MTHPIIIPPSVRLPRLQQSLREPSRSMCQTFIASPLKKNMILKSFKSNVPPSVMSLFVLLPPLPLTSPSSSLSFLRCPEDCESFSVSFSPPALLFYSVSLSLSLLSRIRVSLNEVFNLRRSTCLKLAE